MDNEEKRDRIKKLLAKEMVGVISTISKDGQSQSALLGITETDKIEIIFGTSNTTRKYRNLQHNSLVSFVIGTDYQKKVTVQYEGVAKELTGKELEEARDLHIAKHPGSEEFVFAEDERMFLVQPRWMKYSDYNSRPQLIFELTDFDT